MFVALRGGTILEAANLEHIMGASLSVGAGLASLVLWRATGRAFEAWLGTTLIARGFLLLAAGTPAQPLPLLAVAAITALLAQRAMRAEEVEADVAPLAVLGLITLVGVAAVGSLGTFVARGLLPRL